MSINIKNLSAILLIIVSQSFADELKLAKSMYSNARAWNIGDLVTVIVSEVTTSSKSEAVKTDKSGSAGITEGTFGGATNSGQWNLKRTIIPPMSIGGNSTFSGKGSSTSSEKLTARYTARVIDVLPNGVLLIKGERVVNKNKEKVKMVLSGLIRRYDITSTNTINSDQISDARINYETSGNITRSTKPGWLIKMFQALNPF